MKLKLNLFFVMLILAKMVGSCGKNEVDTTKFSPKSQDAAPMAAGEFSAVTPPKKFYEALLFEKLAQIDKADSAAKYGDDTSGIPLVFVNFNGASLKKGFLNGQSFLLCANSAVISQAKIGIEKQVEILDQVRGFFNKAGIPIEFTITKPDVSDFITVNIAANITNLGCDGSQNVNVLAAQDVGNINLNDMAFVFTDGLKNEMEIAQAIAHAVGLSFGLDQVDNIEDIMFHTISSAVIGFENSRSLATGEMQDSIDQLNKILKINVEDVLPVIVNQIGGLDNLPAELSGLPGLAQLSAIALQLDQLDDKDVLDITNILPLIKQLLPDDVSFPEIDKIVTIIELAKAAALQDKANKGINLDDIPVEEIMIVTGILLTPENMVKIGGIVAMAALGGFSSVAAAVGAIQLAIQVGLEAKDKIDENNRKNIRITGVPDLAALLGLVKIKDFKTLLDNLDGHVEVIKKNFSGEKRDALLTMIKIAYAQAYLLHGVNVN